jgi:aryl-alcohol dehydrogenase-like predicted oxidoreductase
MGASKAEHLKTNLDVLDVTFSEDLFNASPVQVTLLR